MNRTDLNPYIYDAECHYVYDGDSVTLDIDLGLGIWVHDVKARLYGIDTPELRGDERDAGIEARDRLRFLVQDRPVVIETYKDKTGKYGRYLVTLYVDIHDDGELVNVNEMLVDEGLAVRYS